MLISYRTRKRTNFFEIIKKIKRKKCIIKISQQWAIGGGFFILRGLNGQFYKNGWSSIGEVKSGN